MSDILSVVNEVEITQAMVDQYAHRYRISPIDNRDAIVGSISMWCQGQGEMDAYLTDSPEMRDLFAPVRAAFFKSLGATEQPAFSNVAYKQIEEQPVAEVPVEPAPVEAAPVEEVKPEEPQA